MKWYTADLHIHTCLSPCAELDISPLRLVTRAKEAGLDIIAVTDHNSARNAGAAMEVGRRLGVTVLPGMEATSSEEAHVLALFERIEDALALQETIYRALPGGHVSGGRHWQAVVNAADEVEEFEEKVLLAASDLPLGELVGAVRALGGLAIASHLDREAFSVMSQMAFVPPTVRFDAVEVVKPEAALAGLMFHPGMAMIRCSDAHQPDDVGRRVTRFLLDAPTLRELGMALRGEGGRAVEPVA